MFFFVLFLIENNFIMALSKFGIFELKELYLSQEYEACIFLYTKQGSNRMFQGSNIMSSGNRFQSKMLDNSDALYYISCFAGYTCYDFSTSMTQESQLVIRLTLHSKMFHTGFCGHCLFSISLHPVWTTFVTLFVTIIHPSRCVYSQVEWNLMISPTTSEDTHSRMGETLS